ncbi:MAG: 3-hydroxyacyl-CoA dehydrogenase [Deltaproteobacteria bacterium]|nr:MAG: 3-hydroxyacyl-CoA dehydrogenase [Deltaproteobacteria bacterium]HDG98047.1 3-hydroxyacyl-CoA dehydrogenase [Desulfobacterales bacterium]
MNVNGCVAVVTGGASGLGEACVRMLADNEAKVVILDLATDKGEQVAAELGEQASFVNTNVTSEEDVQRAVEVAIDKFGAIHVAINCAGIGIPAKVLGKEGPMSMSDFDKVMKVNLMGTMNVIRLAGQKIATNSPNEEGERGVIINTSSIAAWEGQIGQTSYSASKAAITGITLPIAREFAELGIRVVTIAPGLFDTPMLRGLPDKVKDSLARMVPFPSRFGRPSEFAMLAKHIIENPMLNGTTIRLDAALRMAGK